MAVSPSPNDDVVSKYDAVFMASSSVFFLQFRVQRCHPRRCQYIFSFQVFSHAVTQAIYSEKRAT
jgi:hypothetical protein